MRARLTDLQKQLCNVLQDGLPICQKPYADIAAFLHSNENEVLQQIRELKNAGVIRRISAVIDYHSLGRVSTLVTAHVPEEELGEVAETINSMPGVSHNYLRNHFYNLWFTLQGTSARDLEVEIHNLSTRFGIDFHSLPAERVFKLDVRFGADSGDETLLQDIEERYAGEPVELSAEEQWVLVKLQKGLDVMPQPFDFLLEGGMKKPTVFKTIEGLLEKGVIRRIAAVVDHRRLGFTVNVMFCCKVGPERLKSAGMGLARGRIVSHCYERKPFEGWPYNLFAMMHAKSLGQIQHTIERFVKRENIEAYELLPTETEFKKEPVEHEF